MKLRNPFSEETRNLYLWNHECWVCGRNTVSELHHIWGRISDSALNSAPLCKECHTTLFATRIVRVNLFKKTLDFLYKQSYELVDRDLKFLEKVKGEIKDIDVWK